MIARARRHPRTVALFAALAIYETAVALMRAGGAS